MQTPMKGMNVSSIPAILGLFSICIGLSQSCLGKKKSSTAAGRNIGAVVGVEESKARISSDELNGPSMKLDSFQVSYTEFGKTSIPLISYNIPEKADFVQIIRCDASLKNTLPEEPDSVSQNGGNDTKAGQKINFWNEISSTLGCLHISTGVSKEQHIDYFANSGNWIYLGRACIQPARLPNTADQAEVEPCSRQVSRTPVLSGYVNQQTELTVEKQTEMMFLRDRADESGRNLFYKVRRLKTDILFCEAEKGGNFLSLKRRDTADRILKFGVTLGADLIDHPVSAPNQRKEEISSTLRELDAGAEEFLPSNFCISAEQTRLQIESDRLQMETDAAAFNQNLGLLAKPSALQSSPTETKSYRLEK